MQMMQTMRRNGADNKLLPWSLVPWTPCMMHSLFMSVSCSCFFSCCSLAVSVHADAVFVVFVFVLMRVVMVCCFSFASVLFIVLVCVHVQCLPPFDHHVTCLLYCCCACVYAMA